MKKIFAIIISSLLSIVIVGCSCGNNSLSLEGSAGTNPFDYISVSYTGEDGSGSIEITSLSSMFPINYYTLPTNNGSLSNGETIVISFDKDSYLKQNKDATIALTVNQYQVSGLTPTAETTRVSAITTAPTTTTAPRYYDNTIPSNLKITQSRNGYILPNSNSMYYDAEFFERLSNDQLKYIRNEITARHGRKFNDSGLSSYFLSKTWYNPTYEPGYFDYNIYDKMNDYEKENMKTISAVEATRGIY